ncbi:MAG: M48 family metallopeptidase [Phycisphaeraceae bacterium]|nr:M48 family metallopeptidase [Phycisphaeraceae bacterium]
MGRVVRQNAADADLLSSLYHGDDSGIPGITMTQTDRVELLSSWVAACRTYERKQLKKWDEYARLYPGRFKARILVNVWLLHLGLKLALVCSVIGVVLGAPTCVWICNPYSMNKPGGDMVILLAFFPSTLFLVLGSMGLVTMLRSMRRPPSNEPTGRTLLFKDSPRLFDLVREIERAAGAKRKVFTRIALHDEFGASVRTTSLWDRYGPLSLLGPLRHELLLGMPLLAGVSERQLRAILAHEIGHTAGAFSRVNYGIQRCRYLFARILDHPLAREGKKEPLLRRVMRRQRSRMEPMFLTWFRHQEFAVDQLSVRVTDAFTAGETLLRLHWIQAYAERVFWPHMMAESVHSRSVTTEPWSLMCSDLHSNTTTNAVDCAMLRNLRNRTDVEDSHPCLAERLSMLRWPHGGNGERSPLESHVDARPGPVEQAALDSLFLPDARQCLANELNQHWTHSLSRNWSAQITWIRKQLDIDAPRSTLDRRTSSQVKIDTAIALRLVDRLGEAEFVAESALAEEPDAPLAHLQLGILLGLKDDPRCVGHLHRAMTLYRSCMPQATDALYKYHRGRGEMAEAVYCVDLRYDYNRIASLAQMERCCLSPQATYLPHDVENQRLQTMVATLERQEDVHRVWLAKYNPNYLPEQKLFVLVIEHRFHACFNRKAYYRHMVRQVLENITFDEQLAGVSSRLVPKLRDKIASIRGSLIFDRHAASAP